MIRSVVFFLCGVLLAAAFPAWAEMALYGVARVSVDYLGNNDPDTDNQDYTAAVTGGRSWIGFRGEESIRETLAVIWRAEKYLSLDNGAWGNGRELYLGLSGKAGTVLAGKYATPYRLSSDGLDVFQDTRADFHGVIGNIDGEPVFGNRMKNMLFYKTPQFKRFQLSLSASPSSSDNDSLPVSKDDADRYAFSGALVFDNGPLWVGVAYSLFMDYVSTLPDYAPAASGNASATKVSLGWDFGQGTSLGLMVEDAKNGARIDSKAVARLAYYVNLAHISGNTTWRAAVGVLDDLDYRKDSGANHYAVGFSHAFSPRFDLYGVFTLTQNGDNARYGLVADSDDSDPVGAVMGEDVMAVSFGLHYRFDRPL